MTANPTPEIGDRWRQIDDGRTFLAQKFVGSEYVSGIWLEDKTVVSDPSDETKKRTVKIPQCDGGVLLRSFADASRFKLVDRGRRG